MRKVSSENVAKRLAAVFFLLGYFVAVWYWSWQIGIWQPQTFLMHICFTCLHVTPAPGFLVAIMFDAPVNALLYALIGFLIAKLSLWAKERV